MPTPPTASMKQARVAWGRYALFDRLAGVEAQAHAAGVPVAVHALAWALTQPAIRSLVVGVKRQAQIQEAVAAAEVRIAAEHLERRDALGPPLWKPMGPARGQKGGLCGR